jgi:hypothetical protein
MSEAKFLVPDWGDKVDSKGVKVDSGFNIKLKSTPALGLIVYTMFLFEYSLSCTAEYNSAPGDGCLVGIRIIYFLCLKFCLMLLKNLARARELVVKPPESESAECLTQKISDETGSIQSQKKWR